MLSNNRFTFAEGCVVFFNVHDFFFYKYIQCIANTIHTAARHLKSVCEKETFAIKIKIIVYSFKIVGFVAECISDHSDTN